LQKYKNNRRERKNFPFKKEIIAVYAAPQKVDTERWKTDGK
jgi:hypothetical protein